MKFYEESKTIAKLMEYKEQLAEKEQASETLIAFLENEIERLENEIVEAEARYLMDRSPTAKKVIDTNKAQIEKVLSEIQLEQRFVDNAKNLKGNLKLNEDEKQDIASTVNKALQPLVEAKEKLIVQIKEMMEAFTEYNENYGQTTGQIDELIALLDQVSGKQERRKIQWLFMNTEAKEVELAAKELTEKLNQFHTFTLGY